MLKKRKINLALVGAGGWAVDYHLPAIYSEDLKDKLNLCGIWNRTRTKSEHVAQKWGIPRIYASLDEILQDPDIDAVSVVVNSRAVGQVLTKLSRRNFPVLCEKPPGRDTVEAKKLASIANPKSVVAFNRRYSPLNQKFKSLVDQLDSIQFVECHFLRRNRDDRKFVTETGVHAINFLEYLFGPIRAVDTERWPLKDKKNYNWVARINFFAGLRGVIKFFPFAGISLENMEVHADNVSMYLESDQHFTDTAKGRINVYSNTKLKKISKKYFSTQSKDARLTRGGFIGEYLDLIAAVQTGSKPLSNFENSWASMRVAEIIERGESAVFSD